MPVAGMMVANKQQQPEHRAKRETMRMIHVTLALLLCALLCPSVASAQMISAAAFSSYVGDNNGLIYGAHDDEGGFIGVLTVGTSGEHTWCGVVGPAWADVSRICGVEESTETCSGGTTYDGGAFTSTSTATLPETVAGSALIYHISTREPAGSWTGVGWVIVDGDTIDWYYDGPGGYVVQTEDTAVGFSHMLSQPAWNTTKAWKHMVVTPWPSG